MNTKRLLTNLAVFRLTLALALSGAATGCVVFTFDDGGIRRVPTADVIERPEILLGLESSEERARRPR